MIRRCRHDKLNRPGESSSIGRTSTWEHAPTQKAPDLARVDGMRGFLRRQHVVDGLLAVALWLVSGAVPAAAGMIVPRGILHLAAAVPLVWRRDRPLTVLGISAAFDLAAVLVTGQLGISMSTTCAIYTVCRYATPRRAWIAIGTTFVAYVGGLTVLAFANVGRVPGEPIAAALWIALAATVGQLVRLRKEITDRRRQGLADSAVRAERQRIARELHDVVAHHVTTMNVLVGAARTTMAKDPETAVATLATAEQSGRDAMAEMRQLLFALRTDEGTDDTETYGADRLPALVARAGAAELPATLQVCGERVELPVAVDRAIYRLVQESLTNIRKHAASATTKVWLRYQPDAVEVEVVNEKPPRSGEKTSGGGYGLTGMAERVAFCAGELSTGPTEAGGFRVYARFPA